MSFAGVEHTFRYMVWAKNVMEAALPGVIDVGSSGIAPVTLSELGVALRDLEIRGPHFYGEPTLRRRIARMARVPGEAVLTALGASHAHWLICASLIEPGDEVLVEQPGYEALSAVPRVLGARVVPLPRRFENHFQFDPRDLARRLTRRTRMVLVSNLHNPSGVALAPECLAALAGCAGGLGESARSRGPWVVVNEVYRDFAFSAPPPAGHTLGPRAVSLGSLTKVYGLGDTRVGWAIGDVELIDRAWRVNDFGVVNAPYIAERIGAIAVSRRRRLLARARAILARNAPLLARFFRETAGLDRVPPAAGSVAFPRVRGLAATREFAERAVREHRVCVVPGEFFGAPGHIRIGIGARDSRLLARGLRRLRAAIEGVRAG